MRPIGDRTTTLNLDGPALIACVSCPTSASATRPCHWPTQKCPVVLLASSQPLDVGSTPPHCACVALAMVANGFEWPKRHHKPPGTFDYDVHLFEYACNSTDRLSVVIPLFDFVSTGAHTCKAAALSPLRLPRGSF